MIQHCHKSLCLFHTAQFVKLDLAGADMIRQRMTQLSLTVILPLKLMPTNSCFHENLLLKTHRCKTQTYLMSDFCLCFIYLDWLKEYYGMGQLVWYSMSEKKRRKDLLACYSMLRPLSGRVSLSPPPLQNTSPHVQQRSLLYHLICYIVISAKEALERFE